MPRLKYGLILLIVIVLGLAPRLLAGFSDLRCAEAALAESDYASAAEGFRAAALRLPWRADLWERAGHAAYLGGDFDHALTYFLRAPALSFENRFSVGELYWISNDFDRARAAWESLRADGFESATLYARLAQAYQRNGDEEQELTALQAQVRLDPDDAAALYRLGLLLAARGDESALGYLIQSAQHDPARDKTVQPLRTALNTAFLNDSPAYRLVVIGRALGDLGEWKLAAEAFARATQNDQTYAEAWAWLGEALQQQGRAGREMLAFAYRLNPQSPIVAVLYAMYYQRQENGAEALKLLQNAVDLEPDNPAWLAALASAQAQSGDVTGAAETYQRAANRLPEDPTYWRLLAAFTVTYDHLVQEVGVHAALMAYSLDEKDPANCEIIGLVMIKRAQYESAKFYLDQALALDPQRAAAHFYLGVLYLQQNDLAQARPHLDQARALDPDGPIGAQAARIIESYYP